MPQASTAMAGMTAEEILTPLGLMPGSPNHAKGWTTTLPDMPAGMPSNPPVTIGSFTRTDADTRFQGNDTIYDNLLAQGVTQFTIPIPAKTTRLFFLGDAGAFRRALP